MKGARSIASAVAAFLLVAGLSGGSCQISYCSEDCDPCVAQCKCRTTCHHGLAYDFETVHRLSTFRLAESIDSGGLRSRTISDIVGLSLELAGRPADPSLRSPGDFTGFARAVIEVNPGLLAPRGESWTPEPAQVFQTALVVPFRGGSTEDGLGESLDFLFDRRGNLVEIHQVFGPGR